MKLTLNKYFFLFSFFLLHLQCTFSQVQAAHWIFGKGAHIEFPFGNIDFNNKIPSNDLQSNEGTSTYSDINGELILYSNGNKVYNKYHEEIKLEKETLLGDNNSTQSSLIIPFPGKLNQFLLFTINTIPLYAPNIILEDYFDLGLSYYIINMNKNNGHGNIYKSNDYKLLNRTSQKLSGTFHKNGKDIWIITHFEDKFYSFLVTENGINKPIISKTSYKSNFNGYEPNAKGQLKISSNGKKLAIAHQNLVIVEKLDPFILDDSYLFYKDINGNPKHPGNLFLYDFNNENGLVNNEYNIDKRNIWVYYGLEFSPSGKYLYYQGSNELVDKIFQFNTSNNERLELFTYPENNKFKRGAFQLAINGKIYIANNCSKYLSVINYPENSNLKTDFKFNTQEINPTNFVNLGLPNFIVDYLKEEIKILNTIDGTNACLGIALKFWVNNNQPITSIHWDFGDGTFSSETIPIHTYLATGTYHVKVNINGQEYTKTIIIHEPLNLPTYQMKECDTDGNDITGFDLQNFIDFIGNKAIYITFHNSENDALLNINPIDENDYKFESNGSKSPIWARILGAGGCISITEINFSVDISSIIPQYSNLCKTYLNGNYYISIQSLKDLISDDILVFNSAQDADLLRNQVKDNILIDSNLNDTKLYIRKRNFNACDDIIELNLHLLNPTVVNLEDKSLCPFDGNVNYEIPNNPDIVKIEWKDESNAIISTENSISITKEGSYTVTITNSNGCQYYFPFKVNRSQTIEVKYLIDKNRNLIIDYGSLNYNDYIFSLDNGKTWIEGNTFPNLQLGTFNLWIKEKNGNSCIVYKSIINNNLVTNFFSPNGDGLNDIWIISGFEKYDWALVQIFDRFGKIIVNKKINTTNEIWDGKLNSIVQPSGSYWYKINTSTNESFEGFVTLKVK